MTLQARLALRRPGGFALDVDLHLPGRGISALFGPSGCGKTTVLRALAGLDRAAGRVVLGDEPWQDDDQGIFVPTHRRALGYVIQEAALFPHLSVRGNLDYGRRRAGESARAVDAQAAADLLDLGALMHRRVGALSGGERQRVAIARALATGPRLLLMDEPLAALDAARKAEFLPYLERLHRELALPVVYVTHSMDEVARLADQLVLMDAGRVQANGPLAELLARPDLPLTRLDDAGVVIDAQVLAHDAAYRLAHLGFDGGALWVGDLRAPVGARVRARVMARDVSVARTRPGDSSIVNLLPVVLLQLRREAGSALLQLAVAADDGAPPGPVQLLARITLRSCDTLGLREGDRLTAQIKGVALM